MYVQIPYDVDVRVMLTFLELYQTLLGFVFFKLYTDAGLVYPPPLDVKKYEAAAGVGAFSLQEATNNTTPLIPKHKVVEIDGRTISSKDVRHTIKTIKASSDHAEMDSDSAPPAPALEENQDEDFIPHPSTKSTETDTPLPTLKALESLPKPASTSLFTSYTFFLSRETPRTIFEFLIRSFGGKVGWPASSGNGSPLDEDDPSITHVIIDRPIASLKIESVEEKQRRLMRKLVQPQWVVDCINAGKILLEEHYAQGQILPPHLSPFGEYDGAYDPIVGPVGSQADMEGSESEAETGDEGLGDVAEEIGRDNLHLKETLKDATKELSALHAAELAAEAAGIDYDVFEKEVSKLRRGAKAGQEKTGDEEGDMNKMMMSNRQRKLYEKMKYSQRKKESEVSTQRFPLVCCPNPYSRGSLWRQRKRQS